MLEVPNGRAVYTEEEITTMMKNYFRDTFKPIDRGSMDMETIINKAISPLISEETNQSLIELLDAKEIKDAIFSIHPGKGTRA